PSSAMGSLVRDSSAYQVGSPPWNCGVVCGRLLEPILFEPQNPDAVYAPERICEPELYLADDSELSVTRAVELDNLYWTACRRLDQKLSANRTEFVVAPTASGPR